MTREVISLQLPISSNACCVAQAFGHTGTAGSNCTADSESPADAIQSGTTQQYPREEIGPEREQPSISVTPPPFRICQPAGTSPPYGFSMPNSLVTFNRFWLSSGCTSRPDQPSVILQTMELVGTANGQPFTGTCKFPPYAAKRFAGISDKAIEVSVTIAGMTAAPLYLAGNFFPLGSRCRRHAGPS